MQNTRKGFSLPAVIGIIALTLVILGSFYYASRMREEAEAPKETITSDNIAESEIIERVEEKIAEEKTGLEEIGKDENIMAETEEPTEIVFTGKILSGSTDKLLEFNPADYEKAIASDKLVMLYFYANWCPICKVEIVRMKQAFDELTGGYVVGFQVNYNDSQTDDDEKNLARSFGVSYQHTKVFLKNGERVLKSPESWNKDRYLQEINKFINNSQ